MIQPLVSIIVPIYKVEPYLRRCLDSIVKQTYTNLEIILVDDGSPDGCPQICDEYAGKDSRIKVIHKKNGGQSDARNRGLDLCKGDYISFVDSDDWIENNYIECLYNELIRNKSDISIINHNHYSLDNNYNDIRKFNDKTITGIQALELLITKEPIQHLLMWGKLYRKELFNNIRFPAGKIFEEHLICYKVYYEAKRITCCSKVLYHYLKRDDSTMGKATGINYIPMWAEQADFFKEKKLCALSYKVYYRICKLCLWNFFCHAENKALANKQLYIEKARFYCAKANEVRRPTNILFYTLRLFSHHPNLYIFYRFLVKTIHLQNNP